MNGIGGNIVLTDLAGLGLAPLGDYGGPTQTMALLPGSPAIGEGAAVAGVTTDQRGFALDSPVDIGAFQAVRSRWWSAWRPTASARPPASWTCAARSTWRTPVRRRHDHVRSRRPSPRPRRSP